MGQGAGGCIVNCKPGDLAFVIDDDYGCKSNIGRIVRVVRAATGRTKKWGEWDIEPTTPDFLIYDPKLKTVSRFADSAWAWIVFPDKDLRPIRDPGEDARDETLDWLPVPDKELA